MSDDKKSMLEYLTELDFALNESIYYLDNNPKDDNIINLHNTIFEKYKRLENSYESKFGSVKCKE